jgi:hypothetical protein
MRQTSIASANQRRRATSVAISGRARSTMASDARAPADEESCDALYICVPCFKIATLKLGATCCIDCGRPATLFRREPSLGHGTGIKCLQCDRWCSGLDRWGRLTTRCSECHPTRGGKLLTEDVIAYFEQPARCGLHKTPLCENGVCHGCKPKCNHKSSQQHSLHQSPEAPR